MFSNRDLRRLLIPLIFEQLLACLMGVVDTIMVPGWVMRPFLPSPA